MKKVFLKKNEQREIERETKKKKRPQSEKWTRSLGRIEEWWQQTTTACTQWKEKQTLTLVMFKRTSASDTRLQR